LLTNINVTYTYFFLFIVIEKTFVGPE
jgi:hypothetical protein